MPFKGEFSISIRKGVQSRIVVVELIGEDQSLRGYGEGIPIKSVTGETPESVANDILQFIDKPSFPWELEKCFPDLGFRRWLFRWKRT